MFFLLVIQYLCILIHGHLTLFHKATLSGSRCALSRYSMAFSPPIWFYALTFVEKILLVLNASANFVYYCFSGREFRNRFCQIAGCKMFVLRRRRTMVSRSFVGAEGSGFTNSTRVKTIRQQQHSLRHHLHPHQRHEEHGCPSLNRLGQPGLDRIKNSSMGVTLASESSSVSRGCGGDGGGDNGQNEESGTDLLSSTKTRASTTVARVDVDNANVNNVMASANRLPHFCLHFIGYIYGDQEAVTML